MVTDERLTNLMFLLSFSPLAAGCSVGGVSTTSSSGPPVVDPTTGDDGDDETAGVETAAADTSTGRVDDDDPTPMTDDGPFMTDDGPYMTDDGPYMETMGEYQCMGMPPMVEMIGPLCMQYVGHYNDCFYGGMQPPYCVAIYEAYCQSYIDNSYQMYGPYCAMAIEEAFTCLSQVPCPQLMDMNDDCTMQFMAVGQACSGM